VLFGNILAMDDQTLLVIAFNATITLLVLAVIYRPLVIECVDPLFLRTVSRAGAPAHLASWHWSSSTSSTVFTPSARCSASG